ncbi:DUF6343 family protein [Kineococcus gypseus]|uniref:DUF6343 family protein n=1 Tax=Kineococcus gypseus TaxID=1637102 RepID=UPI003D7D8B4D
MDPRDHRSTARPHDPGVPPEQPRGRTGTEPRTARSPLVLRLVLALFGLVVCAVLGALWLSASPPPGGTRGPGFVLLALAALAVVDVAVVTARLRRRRR